MEKNGNGALAGMLFGFIAGCFLTSYGLSKVCDGYYERGYDKAKSEDRIASLEGELKKAKGKESEEGEEA